MDWLTWKQAGKQGFRKYRYVALVVLLGIFLMLLPEKQTPSHQEQPQAQPGLEQRLEAILSKVEGAGRVEVLLTEGAGERILYQVDGDPNRQTTVLVSDSQRQEEGLIRQVLPPQYQGAVVLCQGAGSPQVRLNLVEAVMDATGLGADKITILKMK